jgi:hypothetical protein
MQRYKEINNNGGHMTTPCEQKTAIDHISHTLERMEKTQDKLVALLEKVAAQDSRLDHLEEHAERNYGEMNEIFNRLREAEMTLASSGPTVRQQFQDTIDGVNRKLDRLHRFFIMSTSKPAMFIYGGVIIMIASGTLLDFVYHLDTMKAIYHFIRG